MLEPSATDLLALVDQTAGTDTELAARAVEGVVFVSFNPSHRVGVGLCVVRNRIAATPCRHIELTVRGDIDMKQNVRDSTSRRDTMQVKEIMIGCGPITFLLCAG